MSWVCVYAATREEPAEYKSNNARRCSGCHEFVDLDDDDYTEDEDGRVWCQAPCFPPEPEEPEGLVALPRALPVASLSGAEELRAAG